MSRGANQKFKFTYLMKIMLEKTDDERGLTMSQILDELKKYDVTAERKRGNKMKYGKNTLWLLVLLGVILISGCGKKEDTDTGGEWASDKIATAKEEAAGEQNSKTTLETSLNQGDKANIGKADPKEDKGDPVDSEDEGTETPKKPLETDYAQRYSKVLDDFYALIASGGDGSVTVEGEGGVGEAIRSNEEDDNFAIVGYAIEDFSRDGIPELIIGDTGYSSTIYTMYACADGEPRCILESYYRSRYSWMGGNEFFYVGSGGAIYSIFAHYTISLEGGELLCQDYYFSHETDETFEEIGFYHNSFGEMDPEVSTILPSEEEFWMLQEELSGRVQEIELIPFSEYEPD